MNSFLICCFPRSRSMWCSSFLTLDGISFCTHEATEYAGDPEEFWANGDVFAKDRIIYGNSDSANIFVLPSLLAERPMTRVVWIARPIIEVCESMKNACMPFEEDTARTLIYMRDKYWDYIDLVLDYQELNTMEGCKKLWNFCLPVVPFDIGRWGMFVNQRICYTKEFPPPDKQYKTFLAWVKRELGDEFIIKEEK